MKSWREYWPAWWLLLILALVAIVRVRLLPLPLERDEGEYACAGQLLLQGAPPYRLIYNMKMPGTYAAYALIMSVFGQTSTGIHLGFMLVNFGAILLLYFVGRRFLDRVGAVAAGAAYAILSLSPAVYGLSAHATHFVMLAALGGILMLLRAQERGRLADFFWSGALFGVAFLMKQPGGAFAFFGLTVLLWAAWHRPEPGWKTSGTRLAMYALGVAVPIVLTALLLWRAGVWSKFWWWTVVYAKVHVTALPWKTGVGRLVSYFGRLSWDGLFWALAPAGLCGLLLEKKREDEKFFFLSLLFFSAAAVCPTFNFTGHYFVLMLPVVALLAARVFSSVAALLAIQSGPSLRWATWSLFGIVWFAVAWHYRVLFLESSPEEASAALYHRNDFAVYPVMAEHLKNHVPPAATFAIFGSEPELLFYLNRRSVTGYIYMYDLVEDQPFRQQMESDMLAEVERGRPEYVVFVNSFFSWLPDPPELFDGMRNWLMHYTDTEYDPYGVVTFPPTQYVWGLQCFNQVPLNQRFIFIFHRKPSGPGR